MFVENQPVKPSMRDFKPGAISVFMNVWPVLKSLPADGHLPFARQFHQRRRVGGQVRRAVGVGNAHLQRGIGVNLAGRNFGIVLLQAALEILERLVHGGGPMEHFGGSAPDHGQPCSSGTFP